MSEVLDENIEPEPAAEETVEAPVAEAAPEPQTTEIDWSDPAILNAAAAHIAQAGYVIQPAIQQQGEPEPEPQTPEFDPFDPESVKAFALAAIAEERAALEQQYAPLQQYVQEQEAQAQDAYLAGEVARAREEAGYTPPGEDPAVRDQQIALLTRVNFQQKLATLPPAASPFEAATRGAVTEQIAHDALKEAVQFWQEHDKQVGEKAIADYFKKLEEDGSQVLDPAIRGAALSTERAPARSEAEVARRFIERRTASPV